MKNFVDTMAADFSSQTHGSSDIWKESVYVCGAGKDEFVPLAHVIKKSSEIDSNLTLQAEGYVLSSLDFLGMDEFEAWFQKSFNRKLLQKNKKSIRLLHFPDKKEIFKAVEIVDQVYQILKDHRVLNNGKNLPIQLGEWYAKCVFGLHQVKSSSQRGFDFFSAEGKKVEVIIHWHDKTSPKGVKLKKSLVEMSEYTIIMYVSKDFRIREILLLDSPFVIRKFSGKGHTIFLKDSDVSTYFFSRSSKHYNKVMDNPALMQFASAGLSQKIDDKKARDLREQES